MKLIALVTFVGLAAFNVFAQQTDCTDVVDINRSNAANIVKTSDGKTCYDANNNPVSAVNGACPSGSTSR